jgi:hypothetical protein
LDLADDLMLRFWGITTSFFVLIRMPFSKAVCRMLWRYQRNVCAMPVLGVPDHTRTKFDLETNKLARNVPQIVNGKLQA